jgi:heme exporter protein C
VKREVIEMNRERWATVGKIALAVWMAAVIVAAFLVPKPLEQGQGGRIFIFHIPVAWVTVLAFLISSVYGIRYLLRKRRADDYRAVNAAGLGVVFCLLATVSGAIFARIAWGAFWNWDPRETTIFFLLLFYAAYFGLRAAVADEERRATFSAAYNVLGLVVVPFLVFIAPRLATLTLHPDTIINVSGEESAGMSPVFRTVFLASLVGFTGIFLWAYSLANRVSRVQEQLLEEDDAG